MPRALSPTRWTSLRRIRKSRKARLLVPVKAERRRLCIREVRPQKRPRRLPQRNQASPKAPAMLCGNASCVRLKREAGSEMRRGGLREDGVQAEVGPVEECRQLREAKRQSFR